MLIQILVREIQVSFLKFQIVYHLVSIILEIYVMIPNLFFFFFSF